MKKWYSFVAALLVGSSVMATVHSVATVGNTFVPATLSINVGDTVTWTIASNHNVNGTFATFPSNPMSFTSGAVGAVATYTFIFQAPGVYNYHCDPHAPSMSGTITVNAATFTSCTDLFISEYLEGSSNNKAIEIYNPTMAPINLANYRVELYGNGGNTPNQNLQLAGTLAPGDVYVIANASADPLILAVADTTSSVTFFNGDDAVTLKKNGLIIDVVGTVGSDPGTNWAVGTGATSEFTLVRTTTTGIGTQSWATGVTTWDVHPQNTFTFLGSHSCSACGTVTPPAPTIAQYTGIDPLTGVADSIGANVTLSGTVFTIDFDGNAGYNFWMHDGTDGIYIFSSPDVDNYVVTQGDQIEVRGSIGQFNGLTQLVPDSIYLVSQNNPIQTPTIVTALDETTESELVRINNVTLVTPSQWPASGSANVDVTDGTNTYLIRIDSDTDIDGSPAPTGPFNVIGAGGQFDNSNPYTGGYQIQPRGLTDIIPLSTITTISQYTGVDPTTGVADSLGANVTLSGTVFTIDFDGNAGYNFWMHDGTDGIYIFSSPDVDNYVVTQGDLIEVRGSIAQFNGLTQLVPDSIYLVSQNNAIQTPTVVTALDETTESELVRINNVTLVTPSQWPATGSANVDVTDGTNTYLIRIDSDTDIDGSPAPTGPFDVIGAGGQFDNSNPYTSGYQIQPRALTDIIPVVVTTPTASFVGTSLTVLENTGTVTVSLQVSPVSANPETITMQVALVGASPADGSITPTPDPVTGIFTLNLPAGADSTGFTITVNDDMDQEPTESITITITGTSAGLATGTPSMFTFSIEDNDTPIPTYAIADLEGVDANGVADSLNVYCKVNGTVFSIDFDGNAGYSFYISDGTGGINVFSFVDAPNSYQSTIGDSIRVIGSILQFNGLTEIEVDSIHFYSAGNPIVAPVVVTALDETTESELVRINGVSLVNPSQWPVAGASANVDITDGVNTFVMRIDSDTDIDGTPPVGGTFDLIGVGNQFDNSSPYTAGYQIFPRFLVDFILPPPPALAITEVMANSNDPVGTLQGDWFEIYNYGNTNINLEGFSFDDNSELSNQYIFPNVDVPPGSAVVVWDGLAADEQAFATNWGIDYPLLNIISRDELTGIGGFPGLSSSADDVVLFDSSAVPVLLCKASYTSTVPGVSMQFDTLCNFLGNSVPGGAEYNSLGGDLGSPGNFNGFFSVEENLVNGFSIYPNPSNGVVTLRTTTGGSKNIQVMNSLGQVVMQVTNDEQETVITLNDLPKGLYIVRLEAGGKQASQTLVLN